MFYYFSCVWKKVVYGRVEYYLPGWSARSRIADSEISIRGDVPRTPTDVNNNTSSRYQNIIIMNDETFQSKL
jgi:hypothetical protein